MPAGTMLRAAAAAVADTSQCRPSSITAPLLPSIADVGDASRRIAVAVAVAAREAGVGEVLDDAELTARIDARRWSPCCPDVVAAR
ncbi:MAG TPA: hypothetical protein VMX12_12915 [Acidimicrobiia bacterium]|nr:hypothetical protein [Acidimicrobiia bacterium]